MRDHSASGVVVTHINPESMARNPAFSHAVAVSGMPTTLYIGGQNAVDADGTIVGEGDLAAQVEQIFHNLGEVLNSVGADLAHIVKWTILVVGDQPIQPGLAAFQKAWGQRANPPAITVARVAGLANPAFLAEIEAIAVIAPKE